MWRDLINKRAIRSALWCALYLIVTILAQNTIFARVRLWGVHAMFVPAVVIAVAMYHGSVWGAVFGLFAGFLCDMGYPETDILFLVLFPVIGFGAGMASEYLFNRTLPAFLCLCTAGFLLTGFAQMFRPWVFQRRGVCAASGRGAPPDDREPAACHPVFLYQPRRGAQACPHREYKGT